ncbi:HK97 family phage prohead protease [Methylobacterium ajmalii]|uniref:HK97 family phage prohead protease n=1 Tax=Methylobacterium ajmalii TaxID=2738439 RepID=A0ABV0A370_9HYPH
MATTEISVDEYLSKRAGFVDSKGHVLKGLVADEKRAPSSFNADAGTVRFTMSAEIEDRDNDIVVQQGLDLTEFLKNPAAPFAHQSGGFPIGAWSDVQKLLAGRPKRTEGMLTLTAGDPVADRLKTHLAAGTIRACSIGFMPKRIERRQQDENVRGWPGYMIHEAELYECSPCMIPANPAALAKSAEEIGLLPREVIERILDEWTLKDGLLVSRKAYEDAHRGETGDRTTIVFAGKTFEVKAGEGGSPILAPVEPSADALLIERVVASEGLVSRLAKALGLKSDKPAAEPEKTVEEKARDQIADDLPALEAMHFKFEAEADLAALDTEIAAHAAS